MIKTKRIFGKNARSMRLSMIVATVLSIVMAIVTFLIVEVLATTVINNVYLSEESRKAREEGYALELQQYVDENKISSDDVKMMSEWAQGHRYLYIMVHQDDKLLYESGMYEKDDKGDTSTDGEPGDPSAGEDGEQNGDEDGTGEESDQKKDGDTDSVGSGITVDLPTREELMAYAAEKEAYLITMSDASVLVSMADYTEYFYYDFANIAALTLAVIVLIVMILIYSHGITGRIYRLASDVTAVADGDMEHVIRRDGEDELGRLSRDVENMRSKMLENLANERAAMDANAELVTSMSHDIRTPLTVLLGYIDVMKERTDDEVMLDYISASRNTALRLKKLSDDMFNYFLLFGAGAAEVNIEEYDAQILFDQLLSEHALLMREQDYDVVVSTDPEMKVGGITVRTDANKLMRIIDNLVSNIVKYADKSAPVLISAAIEGDRLRLTVKNRISSSRENVESNGIGTKTCRKLAQALNMDFRIVETEDEYTTEMLIKIHRTESDK